MAVLPDRPKDQPWALKTPPGTSEYTMHTDEQDEQKPAMEALGLCELEHNARNNRMRAR